MSQDMITYLLLGLVFGAVVLGVLAVAPMFGRKVDMAKRLGMPGAAGAAAGGGAPTLRSDTSNNLWARLVTEVESRGISLHDDKAAVLQERLTLASLSLAQRESIMKNRRHADRTRRLLARSLLALGMQRLTGADPEKTLALLRHAPAGQPELPEIDWTISFSHAGEYAACAIGTGTGR